MKSMIIAAGVFVAGVIGAHADELELELGDAPAVINQQTMGTPDNAWVFGVQPEGQPGQPYVIIAPGAAGPVSPRALSRHTV
jgi:hypothetical protein